MQLRLQLNCWEMPMPTCPNLRRERVINNFNKSLLPIVGDDSNYANAAPLMMVDQVKATRSTISRKPDRKPFFRGGPPATGGTSPRGTGEGAEPKTSTTGFGHIKEQGCR